MYKNGCSHSGFTLVELLVVVVILTILATIGSIYLFSSFWSSRDASRLSTFDLVGTNLELYFTQNSEFPEPDNAFSVSYSGGTAWMQWELWESVFKAIKNLWNETLVDPKYGNYFTYSVTNDAKEYQIAGIMEEKKAETTSYSESQNFSFIPKANAGIDTALIKGNYNEIMVRVNTSSGQSIFIASPSIISNSYNTGILDIISWQHLVFQDFFNLPNSYSWFLDIDKGFNFNVTDPIIFTGSLQELKTPEGIERFLNKLQYIYSVTPTESFEQYINFLQEDATGKIKAFLTKHFKISFAYPFSCQDLYDVWWVATDDYYMIDVDGDGPNAAINMYCDIENDGIVKTRITTNDGRYNHIGVNGGDFGGWNGISTAYYTLSPSSAQNTIVSLTNPGKSSYVLHQTGTGSSNYEVHFEDPNKISPWDEIRMTLWVTWNTGSWSNTLWVNPQAGYMFHNRIYYTDGTFSTNGTSYEIIDSQVIWGRQWDKVQVKHIVQKTFQDFSWFIGYDALDTKDLYITGIELELYKY